MYVCMYRFRQVYCKKHQPSANKRSTFFTRVPFGVLFFFPKSFLNVGGAAYTRVFTVYYNENVAKQSQNTHVEVNILARQKSKARSRVWVAQNNLYIAGTSTKLGGNFAAEMKLHTSFY